MTKKQHSRYWAGSRLDTPENESDAVRLMRLSNLRKGIGNFVKIASGKDIPVTFSSGEQSYTDGKTTVVISATDKADLFDSMVGLALHESSHILYSQNLFTLYERLKLLETAAVTWTDKWFDPKMLANMKRLGLTVSDFVGHMHLILNFLEDRRIDGIMYREIAGYRPYYEELYARYFYSPMCDAILRAPKFRERTWSSYVMHLLNMVNPNADPDALPGLRDIHKIVNLEYIDRYTDDPRWKSFVRSITIQNRDTFPLIAEDAYSIVNIIYDNLVSFDRSEESDDECDMREGNGEGDSDDLSELDDLDQGTQGMTPKEIDKVLTEKDLKKLSKIQKRLVRGNTKKMQLDKQDQQVMTELESADADLREAGGTIDRNAKCKVVVYRKLTKAILDTPSYPFVYRGWGTDRKYPYSVTAVADGLKMGTMLVHRLRIMNDESTMKYSRQEHGRIDKRLLHSLGYGEPNVFSTEFVVRIKPVMVDISIDSSGSMAGHKWQKALTLAVALAYVADKTRSVRVRISVRTSVSADAVIGIIFDSKSDKFAKVRELFPFIGPTGGTPEGLTFEAMRKELLEEVKNTRRYFINLSDGEPAHGWRGPNGEYVEYGGIPAAKHTREQVNDIKAVGIRVLSYFITEYGASVVARMNQNKQSLFHTMYGPDAVFIDTQSIPEIARTLNKMFLQE